MTNNINGAELYEKNVQLQKENEELKEKIEKLSENRAKEIIAELEARFNELYNNAKQLANKYNKYSGNKENELVEIINKTTDERNKYKQENEELKENVEILQNQIIQEHEQYNNLTHDSIDDLKTIRAYKQALEEISSIAENLITETPEYHSCYYKDECGDNCTPKKQGKIEFCCYENVDKILTIINEVLNDRD